MAVILVVDDEAMVLQVFRLALERVGHQVQTAASGAEATRFGEVLPHLDLLIANHRIAPERGRDIAERLMRKHPEMKVMHVSGYTREMMEMEGSLTPGAAFLAKPFTVQQIQTAVANLLGSSSALSPGAGL